MNVAQFVHRYPPAVGGSRHGRHASAAIFATPVIMSPSGRQPLST